MKILILIMLFGTAFPLSVLAEEALPSVDDFIRSGDGHWELRSKHAKGPHADPMAVDEAIAAYREALRLDPESPAVHCRLIRAIFFKGEYTVEDLDSKKKIFDEGKALGEAALALFRREAAQGLEHPTEQAGPVELAPALKDSPEAASCFLWTAATWGEWALAYGKFQAVRQGAAGKIRDLATAVTRIDPNFAEGGGYRVLGRLYHQTPRIPLFTGWATTRKAVEFLRSALAAGSNNAFNRLYLAEALWDLDAAHRPEAMDLLEALIRDEPRPEFLVEDRSAKEKASALLEAWTRK